MTKRAALLVATVSFLLACGNGAEPNAPTIPVSSVSAAASAPDPDVVGDNPAKPRARKPFSIHNSCADVTTVVFGEDPKAPGADRRRIAAQASMDGPRDPEGKQTVSLIDDKGEPIAKVHITRGMKELEIGRSCRTLDAH